MSKRRKEIDSLDHAWSQLETGVAKILDGEQLSKAERMQYYSEVYNYCAQPPEAVKADNALADASRQMKTPGPNHHKKLFDKLNMQLQEFLLKLAINLEEKANYDLLNAYGSAWDGYLASALMLNSIFDYVNRQYVQWNDRQPEQSDKKYEKFKIYNLAMEAWQNAMLDDAAVVGVGHHSKRKVNGTKMVESIMDAVWQDRLDKPAVDRGIIHKVVHSMLSTGPDGTVTVDRSKYQELVEGKYRKQLTEYCNALANKFFEEEDNTTVDYLKMIEVYIGAEEHRIRALLPSVSFSLAAEVCDNVLIRNYVDRLQAVFQSSLENEDMENLGRVFKLANRIAEQLPVLHKLFSAYVVTFGKQSLQQLPNPTPNSYMKALLETYGKFSQMVSVAFDNNTNFTSSLDIACTEFMNTNCITDKFGSKSRKSAEFLCQYTDKILRKDGDENDFDNVMIVFKYLKDKDAFQTYYETQLAGRLIHKLSSHDAEQIMLGKLKVVNGYEYTSRMQRMFQDTAISNDLDTGFKEYLAQNKIELGHDFSPQILMTSNWHFRCETKFTFPEVFLPTVQHFVKYYNTKFEGRQLTWQYNQCRGELQTNFVAQQSHTLKLSLFQMAILLMYNNADSHTLREFLDELKLNIEQTVLLLKNFVNTTILIQDPLTPGPPTDATTFKLNLDYTNQKRRVIIPSVQPVSELEIEKEKEEGRVSDGRSFAIQATIVRIMKTRKQSGYKELMLEVFEQTHKRFAPDEQLFRKCMDILVIKEYLKKQESAEDGNDKYEYLT